MITVYLNDKPVKTREDETILDLAGKHNLDIPTLCHLKGLESFTSCMLCVVEDVNENRLVPACATYAQEGMVIQTSNDRVAKARKDTLDLLLSEHVGNCEAPCLRSCPAYMNIPLMIHQIKNNDFSDAIKTIKQNIALPAVLGRICPAPCERGCNRKYHDETLSICLLKRFAADVDLQSDQPYLPECLPKTGKKTAIIGAGPAGLSAAYYLAQSGHGCDIFDQNELPGGLLRYGIPDEKFDKQVLDKEIEQISALSHINFRMQHKLGTHVSLSELRTEYDAVLIASGKIETKGPEFSELETTRKGIMVNPKTYQTNIENVFAGGNAIAEGRMAIRSLAHGRFMAESVNQLLSGRKVVGFVRRFNSVIGRLDASEAGELLKLVDDISQVTPGSDSVGFSEHEASTEATRCFRCDCRKPESCKLRSYSQQYQADQSRFKTGKRKTLKLLDEHPEILFEPGKCIKCGLCVRITEKYDDLPGMTFAYRGYESVVQVPFGDSLDDALKQAAQECVSACPTGALALRAHVEDRADG